jgi:hypothetical protein
MGKDLRRPVIASILIGFLSASCAGTAAVQRPPSYPPLARAIVTIEDVERSIEDERALSARSARLPRPGEAWFAVLDGCAQVLVTAPHATKPMRDGQLRFADAGTGALAIAIHRLTGARTIHTTMASPADPNYRDDNAFKAAVADALSAPRPVVVLDLHASRASRPYDVDFGTMGRASLLGREDLLAGLATTLAREGLTNQSLDFFAAARNQTITKWVAARGVPAIQLEISATWLSPGAGPLEAHRYAQVLQGIVRFVESTGCAKAAAPVGGRP